MRACVGSGSTLVALVDRRPPLVVSHDAGRTWHEAGAGLPPGRAIAIDADDPDWILFAARHRVWLSTDGGRFWESLVLDLPEMERCGSTLRRYRASSRNSPRATMTALPPTSIASTRSAEPSTRA